MILVIGEYKINCQNESSDVADHCRQYALSDSKVREYQVIILLEFSYIGFLSILHLIINILLLRRNDIISKLISICYFLLRDKGVIINDYDSTLGKYAKFFFANKTYLTQKYSGSWL